MMLANPPNIFLMKVTKGSSNEEYATLNRPHAWHVWVNTTAIPLQIVLTMVLKYSKLKWFKMAGQMVPATMRAQWSIIKPAKFNTMP